MPRRGSEIYTKYAVIGRNIYSYLLYKMLGDNCIVISNKQPFYFYSFDYLIYPTYHVDKFFDYYIIEYRPLKTTIGSINYKPNVKYLRTKMKYLCLNFPIEDDPYTFTAYLPVDLFSKYYMDYEIEKIKIRNNGFAIFLKNYPNIIVCDEIINTLPLIDFLMLVPDLKYLKEHTHYNCYKKYTFLAIDVKDPENKLKYDFNIDYNSYHFDCYRRIGNLVIADVVAISKLKRVPEYSQLLEVQKSFSFDREYNKKQIIKGIWNIGRYAQVSNKYSLDDFVIDASRFKDDDIYSNMEVFNEKESDD